MYKHIYQYSIIISCITCIDLVLKLFTSAIFVRNSNSKREQNQHYNHKSTEWNEAVPCICICTRIKLITDISIGSVDLWPVLMLHSSNARLFEFHTTQE